MGKNLLTSSLPALFLILLSSCTTNGKLDEYHDWTERNEAFINDISVMADASISPDDAQEGDFFRILQFDMDPSVEHSVSNYVYCEVLHCGDKDGHPLFTDSVFIHYRGRMMPTDEHPEGYIFDQSYNTEEVSPYLSVAKGFIVSELVKGMVTALQHMSTGDVWKIYVPYQLGYGTSQKNEIPAYSTLIFDITLEKFRTPAYF